MLASSNPLEPIDPEIVPYFINAYDGNTHIKLQDVLINMPKETIINKNHLWSAINNIGYGKIKRIALKIAQVNPQSTWFNGDYSYFNAKHNELILLFYFLDFEGHIIGDLAYDFQEVSGASSYRTLDDLKSKNFNDRYHFPNQIKDKLENACLHNTRIIYIETSELLAFYFIAQSVPEFHFEWIRIRYAEVDITTSEVQNSPHFAHFKACNKQFNPVFYALDSSKIVANFMAPYDINSLCPPECSI